MNNKTKILYLITKSNWGGAPVYVHDLATSLPQDEYDIKLLSGEPGILNKKLAEKEIKSLEIKNLDRDINLLDEVKVFLDLIKVLKKEKPDIIHLNSSKIAGIGAVAGRIVGVKKIIFTAHGWPFNEDRPAWQKLLILILSYLTVLLSHRTIVIAKKELKQTKNWPFVSNKTTLIYNGVSEIDFLNQEESRQFLINKIPENIVGENTFWLGTISELTKNKGLEYSIKAIKIIKKNLENNWSGKFIVIGEGEDKESLRNLIKKEGLEKDVFLVGFIEDAKKYLRAFDVFILSSIKEGFPYTLLEAGQSGINVISTRVGGTEEIIDNLKNGILVHPKREKEVSNAIRFYLENPDKALVFSEKLKNKIKNKFSTKKMVKKTFELYKN